MPHTAQHCKWWLLCACAIVLAVLHGEPALADDPSASEVAAPKIMVTPILGTRQRSSFENQTVLIRALRKRFGDSVIDAATFIEAQQKLQVTAGQLRTPQGVQRLAAALGAERAIVTVATRRGLEIRIYAHLGERATRKFKVKNVKPRHLSKREAALIAWHIDKKGRVLLLGEPGAMEFSGEEAFATIDLMEAAQPPADDVAMEELREEELASRQSEATQLPALSAAMGVSLMGRAFDLSGRQSAELVKLRTGLMPCAVVAAQLTPLRLVPSWRRSALAGAELDLRYRRALGQASYRGDAIPLDDDSLVGRLRYALPLAEHWLSPWLGLGVGYGWVRSELTTTLAVPSVRYSFVELSALAQQPLWGTALRLEGQVAVRALAEPSEPVQMGPAWQAALWLTWRPLPYVFGRLGADYEVFNSSRDAALVVQDQRVAASAQLGGSL